MKWERDSIFRKKGVAVSWAVSYLLILLIPIAGGFVSSSYTSRVIRQEIQNANQLILSSLQDRIDELMEDEKSALSFLYTNSQLNAFTAIEEGDPYFLLRGPGAAEAPFRLPDLQSGAGHPDLLPQAGLRPLPPDGELQPVRLQRKILLPGRPAQLRGVDGETFRPVPQ